MQSGEQYLPPESGTTFNYNGVKLDTLWHRFSFKDVNVNFWLWTHINKNWFYWPDGATVCMEVPHIMRELHNLLGAIIKDNRGFTVVKTLLCRYQKLYEFCKYFRDRDQAAPSAELWNMPIVPPTLANLPMPPWITDIDMKMEYIQSNRDWINNDYVYGLYLADVKNVTLQSLFKPYHEMSEGAWHKYKLDAHIDLRLIDQKVKIYLEAEEGNFGQDETVDIQMKPIYFFD